MINKFIVNNFYAYTGNRFPWYITQTIILDGKARKCTKTFESLTKDGLVGIELEGISGIICFLLEDLKDFKCTSIYLIQGEMEL